MPRQNKPKPPPHQQISPHRIRSPGVGIFEGLHRLGSGDSCWPVGDGGAVDVDGAAEPLLDEAESFGGLLPQGLHSPRQRCQALVVGLVGRLEDGVAPRLERLGLVGAQLFGLLAVGDRTPAVAG